MHQRRQFLHLARNAAAMAALPRWAWAGSTLRHNPFGLGVASGEPAPQGVVLWTRLLPSISNTPASLADTLTVRWEVANDEAFRRIVRHGTAPALAALGHSVHVELTGLEPDRWYYYRFMLGDAISRTGRTRTAPLPGAMPRHLRLAFASCQRWEDGHYAAWRHLCTDTPDLVLFLGDYIYEYASPRDTTGLARVHSLRHATTLADFRDRHALHKSDPHLQAAHASCPWAVTWDDHEIQNDYAGSAGKGDPAAFLALRSAAWQAFYEHMPLRASSLTARGFALHRRLDWGQLAHIHLLDTRQYRDLQACRRPRSSGAGAVRPDDCAALQDPSRSMLGTTQEKWLDQGLAYDAHTQARWSVLAQTTLFSPRHYPSGLRSTDTWDGYPAARQRLLNAIERHAPRNTVLLGGDIHQNYVCRVPAHPDRPDGPTLASEFCGTSISSRSGTTQQKVDAVARHNPHVLLARCDQRGYGLADLTPARWTTTLRCVDDPLREDSGVHTLARFVVQDGKPGPRQDG
ncbi:MULTISPECIES: alkaline phosphatase [unclassified Simplicispira]|uniref:alkaline phosphatase D family protein n=1 Tax=unclassified Simplicispira TaxID=2630407 RepID=UPI000D5EA32D|nr:MULTISPECIES: alkaline phosphatase D family protein [unclassified Simplicispira]PVY55400.1 alkaline phosphatase D [Simplicispira sp. 125]REG16343.1 alkaline phosphatase D [Simplicispira sp. 110]